MRRSRTVVLTLLLAPALAAAPLGAVVIDRVLAIVNGHLITLSDVRASLQLGLIETAAATDPIDAALDHWIDRILVLEEVERYAPPDPPAEALDQQLARVKARAGGERAYRDILTAYGFGEDWVRQWLRADLRTEAYIDERFAGTTEPTAEELENFYRQNPGMFQREGQDLSAEEAQQLAREHVRATRRRAVIADWREQLRQRAQITRPPAAGLTIDD